MSIFGFGALFLLKEINEEKYISLEEINEIQVEMGTRKVHFKERKESSDMMINLHGKAMQGIKIAYEINNKTLFIKTQPKPRIARYEDVVLDIYIPKEYKKNLSIYMKSGTVKIDSLSCESIACSALAGKLEAEKLNAKKIFINTFSGKVSVKKIDAKELQIKGKTSSISIDECIVKDARIENSTGSTNLKNTSGNLNLNGKSGKVMVVYSNFENQNINIKTTLGSIILKLPSTAEFLLEAKTSTGGFQSDFPIKITDKKNINGQIGTKNNKVLLQTSSGGIRILKN